MTFAGRPLHSVQYKHAIHLAKWHMNRSSVWDWTCTTTTQNILGKRMIRSLLRTSPGKIYEYTPQYIQVLRIVQRPLSRFAKYPIRSNPTSLLISNLHPIANAGIASLVIPTLQSYSTEYYVSMLNTQQWSYRTGCSTWPARVYPAFTNWAISVLYLGGTYPGYCTGLVWIDWWDGQGLRYCIVYVCG